MRKYLYFIVPIISILLCHSICRADTVYLKSGKIIEGEIVQETDIYVRIKTETMSRDEYLMTLVERIEYDQTAEEDPAPSQPPAEEGQAQHPYDVVILKSGKIIKGKIIRKTPVFVRIKKPGSVSEHNIIRDDIEQINPENFDYTEPVGIVVSIVKEEKDDASGDQVAVHEKKSAAELTVISKDGELQSDDSDESAKEGEWITPYRKVISKNSPEPMQTSDDYFFKRSAGIPTTSEPDYNFSSVAPPPGGYSGVPQVSPQDMAKIVKETPHVFNTKAYNKFLDENIDSKRPDTTAAIQKSAQASQALKVASQFGSQNEQQSKFGQLQELVPRIILAIALGALAPLALWAVIFVFSLLASFSNKDRNKELASIEDLKMQGNISEEEYSSLVDDTKNRMSDKSMSTFLKSVPHVFLYPLRGQVILATLGAAVFLYFLKIAMMAPFTGFIAVIFAFTYLVACITKIIETAITEERDDVFDWPSFAEMVDWFGKAFLFIIGWLMCHGTAIIILMSLFKYEGLRFIGIFLAMAFFMIGVFVYPMFILSMSLIGGAASLNVINVIKAIGQTFISYSILSFILLISQGVNTLIGASPLMYIPLFGGILQCFVFAYFLLVNMRLLGVFYKTHRLKLCWYGEDE